MDRDLRLKRPCLRAESEAGPVPAAGGEHLFQDLLEAQDTGKSFRRDADGVEETAA